MQQIDYDESVEYDAILKNGTIVNLGAQSYNTTDYYCGAYEYYSSGDFSGRGYSRGKCESEYFESHNEEIKSILEDYDTGYGVYPPNLTKLDFRSFLCGKETHDTPIIRKILSWAGIQENDVLAFLFTTRYEEFSTIHVKVQISTNVYIQIKSNPAAVIEELTELDNRHQTAANPRDFYYAVRARFNLCMGTNTPAQAARLIYLNKHCFNGLYRVNSSGDFNVPFNGKVSGNSFTASNLNEVSNYLKNVTITTADFEQSLPYIEKEDFVFIDSPYVPTTANSFTGYTMTGFSQNDHLRLHDYCKQLTNKGAYFLMTNSDTSFVRSYYGGYNIKAIDTARRINRNGSGRKGVDLLITNY